MRSTQRNAPAPAAESAPDSVLGRAVALLTAFTPGDDALGISELSRRTGLAKSTTHRLVGELVEHQLLERDGTSYRLGLKLFELGTLAPTRRTISAAALPVMEDLHDATKGRIHLALLDGIDVVYLEVLGQQPGLTSRTGGRLPAHATGVGKVLMAFSPVEVVKARIEAGLPRLTPRTLITPGALDREFKAIRAAGFGRDQEESHLGVSCVSAPIFDSSGAICAALSITGPTRTIDANRLGPAVRTAAASISRTLGYQRDPTTGGSTRNQRHTLSSDN